jgi:hypothetical protein
MTVDAIDAIVADMMAMVELDRLHEDLALTCLIRCPHDRHGEERYPGYARDRESNREADKRIAPHWKQRELQDASFAVPRRESSQTLPRRRYEREHLADELSRFPLPIVAARA